MIGFGNSVWNVMVTMTTVGYGDMYPITRFGRAVAMVAAILGVLLLAILGACRAYIVTLALSL